MSASSRFFGACLATAALTAATKAALSNPAGSAAAILSACAALACASLSSAGATAASRAFLTLRGGGGCAFAAFACPLTSFLSDPNFGSDAGVTPAGATGGAGQLLRRKPTRRVTAALPAVAGGRSSDGGAARGLDRPRGFRGRGLCHVVPARRHVFTFGFAGPVADSRKGGPRRPDGQLPFRAEIGSR
ncbi:hypothetical protein [Amycolatopsis lurida]|uniref:Uncharacterized protein n=1 Tax=Amycolatopsis lurida NRRL 2430 TaxID=1460371 RepID=A0A2P2FZK8_AMYLU|nr:hypothetical protein [Amycolatopsis lurida]KFU82149.1 hypothetical protein BB31_07390 [Amycolatopsis lurida NRRL 2430]